MAQFWSGLSIGRSEILVCALFTLSLADMGSGGYATGPAFAALALSLGLLLLAMVGPRRLSHGSVPRLAAPAFAALMFVRFGLAVPVIVWSSAVMVLFALLAVVTSHALARNLAVVALLVTWSITVALGVALLPSHIDVVTLLQGGATRLLHGLNPYTGSYPSTTPGARTLPYDYSPLTVLLSVPAVLLGNVLYANAVLGEVGLLALMRLAARSTRSKKVADSWLLIPMTICIPLMTLLIWNGWTEVYVVAPFSLWLLLRDRHPRAATACLAASFAGTLLVVPFMVPLLLWSPRIRREFMFALFGSLLVIYVPFIAWTGVQRFVYDTAGFFIGLPTIPHSLALQSILAHFGLPGPNLLVSAMVLVVACIGLTFWKPNDLSDLLLASATFGFVAFLVNRWAFFDYWALVGYVLVAALATVGTPEVTALPRLLELGEERLISLKGSGEHGGD